MRVIVFASDLGIESMLRDAAEDGGFQAEGAPSLQDLASRLYRDPDTMCVLWSSGVEFACMTIEGLRQAGVRNLVFVLLHTGEANEKNRARVLVAGADDVQPAPIDSREYVARLLALTRRQREVAPAWLTLIEGAEFCPETGIIRSAASQSQLTPSEASVLELLVARRDAVCTKQSVYDHLYGGRGHVPDKIVDVFICKLRAKLVPTLGGLDVIETVWGRGYRFIPGGFAPSTSDARVRRAG